jgi:ppGpp synthetase/RelA/SpoT-type nucleotidyltranferase
MSDNDITVITADFMYLVVIADLKKQESIIGKLNAKNTNVNNDNYKYLITAIDYPCASIEYNDIYDLFDEEAKNKCIKFGEGVEPAQTLTFAEGYNKSYYILLEVEELSNEICVRYPKLNLEDETEPEKLISSWIKKNELASIIEKLIIRPVNIVGSDNEILVFAARV